MFYSAQILAKKGPLGTVWIAAHVDRRLKKHQIFETSIPSSVESIINPEAPLALRLSGQLLLGVVRIYNRKVQYLFEDCNQAIVKVQQLHKVSDVDLPDGGAAAAREAVTLPDGDYELLNINGPFTTLDDILDPIEDGAEPFSQRLSMGKRKSLAFIEDDLDPFRTSQRFQDEMFEDAGLDLEQELGVDEPERARAAAAPGDGPGNAIFGLTPGKEADLDNAPDYYPDDAIPATAPEADGNAAAGLPSPGGPLTGPSSDGGGFGGLTPGADALPSIGGLSGPGTPERAPTPRGAAAALARRRRPKLDVSADARPATELPGAQMRALLADRAPLMCVRGAPASRLQAQLPLAPDDARNIANPLLRPAFAAFLAPELQALFAGAVDEPVGSRARPPAGPAASAERPAEDAAAIDGMPMDEAALLDEPPIPDYEADMAPAGPSPEPSTASKRRRDSLASQDGAVAAADGLRFSGGAELGEASEDPHSHSSFTARTRHVAAQLQGAFAGLALEPGSKRSRLSSGAAKSTSDQTIRLQQFTGGRTRIDAARWFFEALVLKTKDFVELDQPEPYADIVIKPRPQLMAGAS